MKKLTVAIIAFAFALTANAYAGGFTDEIVSKLELTPEQTMKFTEVQTKRKTHVANLRKKLLAAPLQHDFISSVYGMGYRFVLPSEHQ